MDQVRAFDKATSIVEIRAVQKPYQPKKPNRTRPNQTLWFGNFGETVRFGWGGEEFRLNDIRFG